jgi:RsiW-degrading membrane proteinase PrsW (M82 family)
MFEDTNLHLFLGASVPALAYLCIIYHFGKQLISWKSSIVYLLFGFISIFFVEMIHFIIPRIHDFMFPDAGSAVINFYTMDVSYSPSVWSWVCLAFVQIAFVEELAKGAAFKLTSFPRRHKIRKESDSLFAIMFYSCCIAVGFAIFENITYAMRYLPSIGDTATQYLMSQRSVFSVISHMIAGLIMGYGFAIGSVQSGFKKLLYPVISFFGAIMYHGTFDYLLLTADKHESLEVFSNYYVHLPTTMLMILSLALAFLLGSHLRSYSLRYSKVLRKRKLSTLTRKNPDSNHQAQ